MSGYPWYCRRHGVHGEVVRRTNIDGTALYRTFDGPCDCTPPPPSQLTASPPRPVAPTHPLARLGYQRRQRSNTAPPTAEPDQAPHSIPQHAAPLSTNYPISSHTSGDEMSLPRYVLIPRLTAPGEDSPLPSLPTIPVIRPREGPAVTVGATSPPAVAIPSLAYAPQEYGGLLHPPSHIGARPSPLEVPPPHPSTFPSYSSYIQMAGESHVGTAAMPPSAGGSTAAAAVAASVTPSHPSSHGATLPAGWYADGSPTVTRPVASPLPPPPPPLPPLHAAAGSTSPPPITQPLTGAAAGQEKESGGGGVGTAPYRRDDMYTDYLTRRDLRSVDEVVDHLLRNATAHGGSIQPPCGLRHCLLCNPTSPYRDTVGCSLDKPNQPSDMGQRADVPQAAVRQWWDGAIMRGGPAVVLVHNHYYR